MSGPVLRCWSITLLEYIEAHNEAGKPFKWTKTADQILESVKRFGQRTLQVHGGKAQ